MAKEKIIEIKTGDAVKNIQDLNNNISAYKTRLKELEIGTKDYQETLTLLQQNQAALRNAMYGTSASMQEVQQAAIGLDASMVQVNADTGKLIEGTAATELSYNGLVRTLAVLKQEWRATADEQKRAELGEKINAVNNRLKELDASVGNYQRNVGMYSNVVSQLGSSLSSIAPAAGKVVGGIKQMDAGLKLLSTNPVVGVLTILVPLIQSVASALKSSEDNANATASAFSTFAAVGDLLKVVFQTLGQAIANVIQNFATLLGDIFPALQRYAENRIATTQEEIDLEHRRRIVLMQNADDEKRVAQYRQEAADKYHHTAQERLEFLQKANDAQERIAQRNKEIAEKEYEIQKNRARMAGNSKEENDKLAQAYAKMVQADTAYYQATIRTTSQMSTARKEMAAEAEAARKKEMEAITAYLTELQKIGDEIDAIIDKSGEALVDSMEKGWEKQRGITDRRIEGIEKAAQTQLEWNDILTEDEDKKAAKRYEINQRANEQILAALRSAYEAAASSGDLDGMLEYEQQIADMEVEIEMSAAEEKRRIREADLENAKEMMEERLQLTQATLSATSDLFSAIADIYENDTKATKAEAEKAKNLRIAGATIDMLSGVVAAIATAQKLGPPMGPIVGALNAATVVAAGVANIAKIKATKVSTSGSSSVSASVPAPAVTPEVNQVRTITSASEEDRLNQMAADQRVYILDSDIQASNDQRRVEVSETSF